MEGSTKFELPSHFMDYLSTSRFQQPSNRTVHDNHKRTPTAPKTTIMSGSEQLHYHSSSLNDLGMYDSYRSVGSSNQPTLVWGSRPQTFRGAVAFWTLGMQFHPGGALGACRVLWSCAARVSPASPLPFDPLSCACITGPETILNTLLRCWALGQTLNRQRYQPRSERRRAGAAEIPSLPPTLTNDHHHIHLKNQGDGRSGEEERDLLLFLTVQSGTPTAGGGDGAGCQASTGANGVCRQSTPHLPLNAQSLIAQSESLSPDDGDGDSCAPPGAGTPPSGARDGPSGTSVAPSGTEDYLLLFFGALRSLCFASVSPPSGKQLCCGGRGGRGGCVGGGRGGWMVGGMG
ncbi:hypothetical protein BTUL_0069g00380 [Botrytis tulipae]|uniref:Uncharacterized protein n=1 Tax=Botrytis tulipae TaxID=87230 RepID=A0A4Z1EWJ1_9HELO|nr:hypothetical protein BTUL_0069g00380 [Botrytis tulipae]